MKNGYPKGMIAGAIAGVIDNIASVVVMYFGIAIGIMELGGLEIWSLEVFIIWATSHLSLNVIWGIIFAIIGLLGATFVFWRWIMVSRR